MNKKEKAIEGEVTLNDLIKPLINVEKRISSIDRAHKKNYISMELIKEELEEKKKNINSLNIEIKNLNKKNEKLIKKMIYMLDQIDNIYEFADDSQNKELIKNLNSIKKGIEKELREVGIEEIPAVGTIFNETIHECIDVVQEPNKSKYEVVGVLKKGYRLDGKVIRVASVIANK